MAIGGLATALVGTVWGQHPKKKKQMAKTNVIQTSGLSDYAVCMALAEVNYDACCAQVARTNPATMPPWWSKPVGYQRCMSAWQKAQSACAEQFAVDILQFLVQCIPISSTP